MDLHYVRVNSTVKPDPISFEKTTVYLRKDITAENLKNSEDDTILTYYNYMEAALTYKEFEEYSALISGANAIKGADDSEHISQMIENQKAGDDNQLTIMEAIADLYDIIANMQ